jgi:hypothetical protein
METGTEIVLNKDFTYKLAESWEAGFSVSLNYRNTEFYLCIEQESTSVQLVLTQEIWHQVAHSISNMMSEARELNNAWRAKNESRN